MSVYIDNAQLPFGRMLMCHMAADSTDELLQMADTIGVARKWIQHPGTFREHFDICKAKRMEAIKAGAIPVTGHYLGERILRLAKEAKA